MYGEKTLRQSFITPIAVPSYAIIRQSYKECNAWAISLLHAELSEPDDGVRV